MNTSLAYLTLSLLLLAGCSPAPKTERVDGSGCFMLTNTPGTVFWGHIQDAATNDIQFVLLLPENDQFGNGTQSHGDTTYDYCDLKSKPDGHEWKIEAQGNLEAGTAVLRFSDLTAGTVTNIDLSRSRFWQISADRVLIPLDKIDPAIMKTVLHESEAGFKRIQSRR